ncbi:MAG: DUF6105 family protein [Ahrensia sp.]
MRYIFYFWFLPMSLFWAWFGLSYNDINLGTLFFSRDMHELVFAIYGSVLNLDYDTVVKLLIRACIVDTFLIFGIFAFRRRKQIKAWWQNRKTAQDSDISNQETSATLQSAAEPAE